MYYLLFYEKDPGYAQREEPWRAAHRDHVFAAARRGQVVLAGSLADPVDGTAVLVFRTPSAAPVEAFAVTDPYVVHGIVSRWRVREWQIVVGEGTAIGDPAS